MDSKTKREKDWHNKRFASGEDTRATSKVSYAYQAIKYAERKFKFMQKKTNLRVLDVGCGRGIQRALDFIELKCIYTGIDISEECIKSNISDIKNISEKVNYLVDDANLLSSLKGQTFDLIILTGTLHHLDIDKSLKAIKKVLNPSKGEVLMWEPMGTNPIINLFRNLTPNLRTPDEKPLNFKDLKKIKKFFPNTRYELHSLLSIFVIPLIIFEKKFINLNTTKMINFIGRFDELLGKIPFLRRLCWIVIIRAKS